MRKTALVEVPLVRQRRDWGMPRGLSGVRCMLRMMPVLATGWRRRQGRRMVMVGEVALADQSPLSENLGANPTPLVRAEVLGLHPRPRPQIVMQPV